MSIASAIETRPVAGVLGAELTGVHLEPTLGDEVITDIRDAILKHKVVFIRGSTIWMARHKPSSRDALAD